jgi:predicted O-methyltransferase YrrM
LNNFKEKAWLTGRFIKFTLHAGNRYHIHSPFLYSFVAEVLRKDKKIEAAGKIESLRKDCLNSNEIINKTDYGHNRQKPGVISYPVLVKQIASSSLSAPRQARRLFRLAKFTGAGRILEIGTSLGLTSSYLAFANPGGKVITLEGCPELSRKAREHFTRLGIDNTELIEGRFEETLDKALEKLGSVDLVYIDGNHRKEALLDYFERCMNYVNNNSVIVCDDIHSSREMEQAWEEITGKKEVTVSLDLFFSGWVFFRKESSRQHFRLRYV